MVQVRLRCAYMNKERQVQISEKQSIKAQEAALQQAQPRQHAALRRCTTILCCLPPPPRANTRRPPPTVAPSGFCCALCRRWTTRWRLGGFAPTRRRRPSRLGVGRRISTRGASLRIRFGPAIRCFSLRPVPDFFPVLPCPQIAEQEQSKAAAYDEFLKEKAMVLPASAHTSTTPHTPSLGRSLATRTRACTRTHTHLRTFTHTRTHTHTNTHTHTHTHTGAHALVHALTRTYARPIQAPIRAELGLVAACRSS